MFVTILLVVAFLCFIFAATGYPPGPNIGWVGAALVTLTLLIPQLH